MPNRTPTVSVILTSYNHGRYIGETIENVLRQSFTDYELIIADDASTDSSWEVIQSYKDPRILARQGKVNRLTGNFFEALGSARGRYLAVHHSGDLWAPDKLQKQVDWLEAHPEHVAVFTHAQGISEDGAPVEDELIRKFRQPNRTRQEWLNYFFYNWNAMCHPSVLMRMEHARNIYTLYGPTSINDWGVWIRTCCEHEIHILQEPLTIFRRMSGDASAGGAAEANRDRAQLEALRILHYFRGVGTVEDWLAAFPETREYYVDGEFVSDYALARISLAPHPLGGACFPLFGILLLFELLAKEESRLKLERLYRFGPKEMREITGGWRLGMTARGTGVGGAAHARLIFADGTQSRLISAAYTAGADGRYEAFFDFRDELHKKPKMPVVQFNLLPLYGQPCRHTVISCTVDGTPVTLEALNRQGVTREGEDAFSVTTPVYLGVPPLPRMLALRLEGRLRLFSHDELLNIYAALERENQSLREQLGR